METFLYNSLFDMNRWHAQNKQLLSEAFYQNPRLRSMVNNTCEQTIREGINSIVSFAYNKVEKLGGIVTSIRQDAILLYYQKSCAQCNTAEVLAKLDLILFTFRKQSLWTLFKNESQVKQWRKVQAQEQGDLDYLYVWFLAQDKNTRDISSLVELKNQIVNKSKSTGLPIYIETVNPRMVAVYKRMGFQVYKEATLGSCNINIWMFRYNPFNQ